MIELELRSVPAGATEYVPVARIRVDDDGTSQVWDPEDLFPFGVHALVAERSGLRRVTFEDEPQVWVRGLDTILRTGYLVPVVTHDDALSST